MKKIIDFSTKEEIKFISADLPMLIHGREHSGASLFSITVAAQLHIQGEKLLIFTAYPMAKEEFMIQVGDAGTTVYFLENEAMLSEALKFQTVIIKSGDVELFLKVISNKDFKDRVLFIKNIETINIDITKAISSYRYVVSGDIDENPLQSSFKNLKHATRIFFSTLGGETVPILEKYHSYMKNPTGEKVLTLS